jgi:hypothetical protein
MSRDRLDVLPAVRAMMPARNQPPCSSADRVSSTPNHKETTVANSNALAGLYCPQCGSTEPFRLEVTQRVVVWDAGIDPLGEESSPRWTDASYCQCSECDADGTVADFRTPDAAAPAPEADPAMGHNAEAQALGETAVAAMQTLRTGEGPPVYESLQVILGWAALLGYVPPTTVIEENAP